MLTVHMLSPPPANAYKVFLKLLTAQCWGNIPGFSLSLMLHVAVQVWDPCGAVPALTPLSPGLHLCLFSLASPAFPLEGMASDTAPAQTSPSDRVLP